MIDKNPTEPESSRIAAPKLFHPWGAYMKTFINGILKRYNWEIRRPQPRRMDFLLSRRIDAVVDVGANVGQFGQEIRREGFSGHIYSFEPVRASFDMLSRNSARDPNWDVFPFGTSDTRGCAKINVSQNSVFNSLHQTTAAALRFDPMSSAQTVEEIELRPLDDVGSEIKGDRLFLKVDTQGHEPQVLAGAGSILARVQGIQLELPISTLYEGSWTMGRALEHMRSIGFVPTYFWPVGFQKTDPVAMVEVDCIFRRFDPNFD